MNSESSFSFKDRRHVGLAPLVGFLKVRIELRLPKHLAAVWNLALVHLVLARHFLLNFLFNY